MIRPSVRLLPYLLLISLVALAPTVALLVITYRHAIRRAQSTLDDHARLGKRRIDELLMAADTKLARLIAETGAKPTPQLRSQLDRLVYADLRFRESGVTDPDGRLVLTDRGPVEPPVVVAPNERVNPGAKTAEVVGRVRTKVMQEESIIIGRPTTGQGSVNLLVQPDVLTLYLDGLDLGETGFLVFVRATDSQLLAGVGAMPNQAGIVVLTDPEDARLRAEAVSSDGRVRVVVESECARDRLATSPG